MPISITTFLKLTWKWHMMKLTLKWINNWKIRTHLSTYLHVASYELINADQKLFFSLQFFFFFNNTLLDFFLNLDHQNFEIILLMPRLFCQNHFGLNWKQWWFLKGIEIQDKYVFERVMKHSFFPLHKAIIINNLIKAVYKNFKSWREW